MNAYPVVPGCPAAEHVSGGFWHPGQVDGCPKCTPPPPRIDKRSRRRGQAQGSPSR